MKMITNLKNYEVEIRKASFRVYINIHIEWEQKHINMNILLIAKLANHTIRENVLTPILASGVVKKVWVFRDVPAENFDERMVSIQ